MHIPLHNVDYHLASVQLVRRENSTQNDGMAVRGSDGGGSPSVVIGVVIIVVVVVLLLSYILFRNWKLKHSVLSNKSLPGDALIMKIKKLVTRKSSRGDYSTQLQPNSSAPTLLRPNADRNRNRADSQTSETMPGDAETEMSSRNTQNVTANNSSSSNNNATTADTSTTDNAAGIDRNTSVRSVMTLPAYTPSARPSEQILGREGERAGVDVVLEFPETIDEEESRREEEMESLYQIRRQRREEQAEREERRRLRREARARGDTATLNRLQAEARRRTEEGLRSQELIQSHQSATQNRERRVSAVQYQNVGVARHDGSRVRANSTDSDNRPLLDSAAGMAGLSSISLTTSNRHERMRSSLSLASASSDESGTPVSRRTSRQDGADGSVGAEGFEVISLQASGGSYAYSHATPSPGGSGSDIPADQPPDYDGEVAGWGDAPPYEDVAARQASVRSQRRAVGAPSSSSTTTGVGRTASRALHPTPRERDREDDHSGVGESDNESDDADAPSRISVSPPQLPAMSAIPSIEVTAFSPVSRGGSVRSFRTAAEGQGPGQGR